MSLQEKQLQKLKARESALTTKLLDNKFDDDLEQGISNLRPRALIKVWFIVKSNV